MNREEDYTFKEIDRSLSKFRLYLFVKALLKNLSRSFAWFLVISLAIGASLFAYQYNKPLLFQSELYVKSNYFNSETCRLLANDFVSNHSLVKLEAINTTNHHEWFNRLSLMSQAFPAEIKDWVKFQEMTAFRFVLRKKEDAKPTHKALIEFLENNPYSMQIKSGLLANKKIEINKLEAQVSSLQDQNDKSKNQDLKLIELQAEIAKSKVDLKQIKNISVLIEKDAYEYRKIDYKMIVFQSIIFSLIVFACFTLFRR